MVAYTEKTAQAKKVIKAAKQKAWERECEKIDAGTNTRLFAAIRAMDGRRRKQKSAAVLKTDNKTAVTAKEALTLTTHYANVSQALLKDIQDSKRTT